MTHHHDEAYIGALAVVLALQGPWRESPRELLGSVAEQLPDSRVRDRLRTVRDSADDIGELGRRFGTGGYVVETVPLALVAGWLMAERGFGSVLDQVTDAGGDTDTIASIAGQLAGARLGVNGLPEQLLEHLPERPWVTETAEHFRGFVEAGRHG